MLHCNYLQVVCIKYKHFLVFPSQHVYFVIHYRYSFPKQWSIYENSLQYIACVRMDDLQTRMTCHSRTVINIRGPHKTYFSTDTIYANMSLLLKLPLVKQAVVILQSLSKTRRIMRDRTEELIWLNRRPGPRSSCRARTLRRHCQHSNSRNQRHHIHVHNNPHYDLFITTWIDTL
jgi:hypothetical protein